MNNTIQNTVFQTSVDLPLITCIKDDGKFYPQIFLEEAPYNEYALKMLDDSQKMRKRNRAKFYTIILIVHVSSIQYGYMKCTFWHMKT